MKTILLLVLSSLVLFGCNDNKNAPASTATVEVPPLSGETCEFAELGFAGLKSIDDVGHRSVRLNWDKVNGAVSYQIFKLTQDGYKFVTHTGGGASKKKIGNLQPGTDYTYRVWAMDENGQMEPNEESITVQTLDYGPYVNGFSLALNGSQNVVLPHTSNMLPNNNKYGVSLLV
jgi:hypothetical protein